MVCMNSPRQGQSRFGRASYVVPSSPECDENKRASELERMRNPDRDEQKVPALLGHAFGYLEASDTSSFGACSALLNLLVRMKGHNSKRLEMLADGIAVGETCVDRFLGILYREHFFERVAAVLGRDPANAGACAPRTPAAGGDFDFVWSVKLDTFNAMIPLVFSVPRRDCPHADALREQATGHLLPCFLERARVGCLHFVDAIHASIKQQAAQQELNSTSAGGHMRTRSKSQQHLLDCDGGSDVDSSMGDAGSSRCSAKSDSKAACAGAPPSGTGAFAMKSAVGLTATRDLAREHVCYALRIIQHFPAELQEERIHVLLQAVWKPVVQLLASQFEQHSCASPTSCAGEHLRGAAVVSGGAPADALYRKVSAVTPLEQSVGGLDLALAGLNCSAAASFSAGGAGGGAFGQSSSSSSSGRLPTIVEELQASRQGSRVQQLYSRIEEQCGCRIAELVVELMKLAFHAYDAVAKRSSASTRDSYSSCKFSGTVADCVSAKNFPACHPRGETTPNMSEFDRVRNRPPATTRRQMPKRTGGRTLRRCNAVYVADRTPEQLLSESYTGAYYWQEGNAALMRGLGMLDPPSEKHGNLRDRETARRRKHIEQAFGRGLADLLAGPGRGLGGPSEGDDGGTDCLIEDMDRLTAGRGSRASKINPGVRQLSQYYSLDLLEQQAATHLKENEFEDLLSDSWAVLYSSSAVVKAATTPGPATTFNMGTAAAGSTAGASSSTSAPPGVGAFPGAGATLFGGSSSSSSAFSGASAGGTMMLTGASPPLGRAFAGISSGTLTTASRLQRTIAPSSGRRSLAAMEERSFKARKSVGGGGGTSFGTTTMRGALLSGRHPGEQQRRGGEATMSYEAYLARRLARLHDGMFPDAGCVEILHRCCEVLRQVADVGVANNDLQTPNRPDYHQTLRTRSKGSGATSLSSLGAAAAGAAVAGAPASSNAGARGANAPIHLAAGTGSSATSSSGATSSSSTSRGIRWDGVWRRLFQAANATNSVCRSHPANEVGAPGPLLQQHRPYTVRQEELAGCVLDVLRCDEAIAKFHAEYRVYPPTALLSAAALSQPLIAILEGFVVAGHCLDEASTTSGNTTGATGGNLMKKLGLIPGLLAKVIRSHDSSALAVLSRLASSETTGGASDFFRKLNCALDDPCGYLYTTAARLASGGAAALGLAPGGSLGRPTSPLYPGGTGGRMDLNPFFALNSSCSSSNAEDHLSHRHGGAAAGSAGQSEFGGSSGSSSENDDHHHAQSRAWDNIRPSVRRRLPSCTRPMSPLIVTGATSSSSSGPHGDRSRRDSDIGQGFSTSEELQLQTGPPAPATWAAWLHALAPTGDSFTASAHVLMQAIGNPVDRDPFSFDEFARQPFLLSFLTRQIKCLRTTGILPVENDAGRWRGLFWLLCASHALLELPRNVGEVASMGPLDAPPSAPCSSGLALQNNSGRAQLVKEIEALKNRLQARPRNRTLRRHNAIGIVPGAQQSQPDEQPPLSGASISVVDPNGRATTLCNPATANRPARAVTVGPNFERGGGSMMPGALNQGGAGGAGGPQPGGGATSLSSSGVGGAAAGGSSMMLGGNLHLAAILSGGGAGSLDRMMSALDQGQGLDAVALHALDRLAITHGSSGPGKQWQKPKKAISYRATPYEL
eukprot:g3812.t1